jgi:uncharacterized protein (DUF3084 family)
MELSSAVMTMFRGMPSIKEIAAMNFKPKVEMFVNGAASEMAKCNASGRFDRAYIRQLKGELNNVAAQRNRIMHGYWTYEVETQRKVLKDLKERAQNIYPTAKELDKLSDRIYEVRSRLAPLATEYLKARRRRAATLELVPGEVSVP